MNTKNDQDIIEKAKLIKLVVFDVDGVFTDGSLYYHDDGQETKAFNTQDGQGVKMLHQQGIETAIITGRTSNIVKHRAQNLGVLRLVQGREDKLVALNEILSGMNLTPDQVAYAGDDLPDLPAICYAGLGIAVANAHSFVALHADWQTSLPGGNGAVREICDFILDAKGLLSDMQNKYLTLADTSK